MEQGVKKLAFNSSLSVKCVKKVITEVGRVRGFFVMLSNRVV
jgi:hypothetical protein